MIFALKMKEENLKRLFMLYPTEVKLKVEDQVDHVTFWIKLGKKESL